MINYTTFDKAFVVVNKDSNKAFMVDCQYKKDTDNYTKACSDKIATAKKWGCKDSTEMLIDNVPMHGFKIHGYSSRYRTSNKFVCVEDPRGFVLEISIENIIHMFEKEIHVKDSVILDKRIWARANGSWCLISESENIESIKMKEVSPSSLEIGDVVNIKSQTGDFIYCGQLIVDFDVYNVDINHFPTKTEKRGYGGWVRNVEMFQVGAESVDQSSKQSFRENVGCAYLSVDRDTLIVMSRSTKVLNTGVKSNKSRDHLLNSVNKIKRNQYDLDIVVKKKLKIKNNRFITTKHFDIMSAHQHKIILTEYLGSNTQVYSVDEKSIELE